MILIVFMGCGKTTIAHELDLQLNKKTIDLDDLIRKGARQPLTENVGDEGEAAFREYKFQALQSILKENAIIATGGGVVTYEKSYALLKELTAIPVFLLNAPFDDLYSRIQKDDNRPLGNQDIEKVRALYNSRLDKYSALADREISTSK